MGADSARWTPDGSQPDHRSTNIYEHVSNLNRAGTAERIAQRALEKAKEEITADTGNSYEIKAWAAVAHLIPAAARMAGILGKAR